jgi:hypothetical protein
MTKRILVSVVVNRWIEVPNDADEHSVFYETDGIFEGIDGDLWDIHSPEIVDEEDDSDI